MFSFKSVFLNLFVGCILCFSALGLAQQSPKSQPDAQQANISDSDLRAFVKAYVDTQRIRGQYEPSLLNSTDTEKNQQTQDQANAALKKALAKYNLSIEKYNMIYNQVNSDEQLRKKVLKMVEEERQKTS
jgi:hypothetical protein